MTTTLDIPDSVFEHLQAEAMRSGQSVEQLILDKVLRDSDSTSGAGSKLKFPAIESNKPGSLKLGPEGVYEYISFP